jgi:transcription elongation factor Elf1
MIDEKSIKYGQSFATNAEFREMNKGFTETLKKSKEPVKEKRLPGQRPRMLVCPLCGREFGSMSLNIHMKSCKEKFERQQRDLPPNQRRNADKIIASYNANNARLHAGGNYNMDALNQQAFDQYNNDALVKCEYCGRTFLPDRLAVHQRVCAKHPEMFKKK